MDVAPNQIASIAASCIPFLEHDDANRALMGSNMQRQAVPLLRPKLQLLVQELRRSLARDSRVLINAEGTECCNLLMRTKLSIKYERTKDDELVSFNDDTITYTLTKFQKTNQNTMYQPYSYC